MYGMTNIKRTFHIIIGILIIDLITIPTAHNIADIGITVPADQKALDLDTNLKSPISANPPPTAPLHATNNAKKERRNGEKNNCIFGFLSFILRKANQNI
jgi:hypothetical protein